jgi:phenylacetate-CoA ligase
MHRTLLQERWQQLPENAIRRLQTEQLRHYLAKVVLPFSAHYQRVFRAQNLTADSIRTLEDLEQVPFTTKADLINTEQQPQKFKDFIVVPDEKVLARRPGTICRVLLRGRKRVKQEFESEFRPIFVTFTTGRSAEPTPFFYSQYDLNHLALAGRRMVEVCTARPDARLLSTLPFAPHLAFWLMHYAGATAGLMTVSSGGGKVLGTDGNLRYIRKFKPDVIIGIPTFIYHLMHQAVEEGVRCENLQGFVLAGEKVNDGLRQKLRELARQLGAPNVTVLATYGFTEAKQAWGECPFPHNHASSGYHLYPDLGIIEVVDPQTGKPLPPGQPGEIVFTPLDARGTVVLRYRTGDYIDGGLTYEPCPYCGRTLPRLVGNLSRRSEVKEMNFDKIKGTLVDFNELEHVLDDAQHIGAWQVELRKVQDDPLELDEVILHVQKINGTDEALVRRQLNERCSERLEIRPNRVLFHSAEEMQRLQGVGTLLKEQKLVDHRPTAKPVAPEPMPAVAEPNGQPRCEVTD